MLLKGTNYLWWFYKNGKGSWLEISGLKMFLFLLLFVDWDQLTKPRIQQKPWRSVKSKW